MSAHMQLSFVYLTSTLDVTHVIKCTRLSPSLAGRALERGYTLHTLSVCIQASYKVYTLSVCIQASYKVYTLHTSYQLNTVYIPVHTLYLQAILYKMYTVPTYVHDASYMYIFRMCIYNL